MGLLQLRVALDPSLAVLLRITNIIINAQCTSLLATLSDGAGERGGMDGGRPLKGNNDQVPSSRRGLARSTSGRPCVAKRERHVHPPLPHHSRGQPTSKKKRSGRASQRASSRSESTGPLRLTMPIGNSGVLRYEMFSRAHR